MTNADDQDAYASAYYEASNAPQFEANDALVELSTANDVPTSYELVPLLSHDNSMVQGFSLLLPSRTTLLVRLDACTAAHRGHLEVLLDNHVLLQGADDAPTAMHMALDGMTLNYTYAPAREQLSIQTRWVNVSVWHELSCSLDVLTFERGEPLSVRGDTSSVASA